MSGWRMFENKERKNEMKKRKLWYGSIEGIFGYGICAISETKAGVMKTLKESYESWKKAYPDESTNFKDSFEHWGGWVRQIELNRGYDDGMRE